MKKLNIGILGTRGIPNSYGGFEALAEAISLRLVKKGHRITVYCSHDQKYRENTLNGAELIFCKNPESMMGNTGQFIYDLNCNLHARRQPFDILLHLGYTSDSIWSGLWRKKTKHIVNMDGIEWSRSKYAPSVQAFLHKAEKWAANHCSLMIADSMSIHAYLSSFYKTPVSYISYGAEIPVSVDEKALRKFLVKKYEYDLLIARMEPENNIEMAIKAKLKEDSSFPLLIFSNATKYGNHLISKYRDFPTIRFQEAHYQHEDLNPLRYYSRYYIHGHSVGGTNPSLLEAMACGCRILAHQNVYNQEVLEQNAKYYHDDSQLAELLNESWSLEKFDQSCQSNLKAIVEKYNWESVTDEYEQAFYRIINQSSR
jgi:glycosyltransferase involved in cell wall biosynthesis